jgi:hypothetical protein
VPEEVATSEDKTPTAVAKLVPIQRDVTGVSQALLLDRAMRVGQVQLRDIQRVISHGFKVFCSQLL